jgi:hypothetical protein
MLAGLQCCTKHRLDRAAGCGGVVPATVALSRYAGRSGVDCSCLAPAPILCGVIADLLNQWRSLAGARLNSQHRAARLVAQMVASQCALGQECASPSLGLRVAHQDSPVDVRLGLLALQLSLMRTVSN